MVIKILNMDKLISKLTSTSKNLDNALEPAIKLVTAKLQAKIKTNAPVRTGILRNSIKTDYDKQKKQGKVYTNVEYAPHVEYGTRRQSAQPFFEPAIQEMKPTINDEIKKAVSKELKKLK